jgi:hypothetical protein
MRIILNCFYFYQDYYRIMSRQPLYANTASSIATSNYASQNNQTQNNQTVAQLYNEHHGWLFFWLSRKVGYAEQAADLAQDTFCLLLPLNH